MDERTKTLGVIAAILATRVPHAGTAVAGQLPPLTPQTLDNCARQAHQLLAAVEDNQAAIKASEAKRGGAVVTEMEGAEEPSEAARIAEQRF